jgi:hypothetical protein
VIVGMYVHSLQSSGPPAPVRGHGSQDLVSASSEYRPEIWITVLAYSVDQLPKAEKSRLATSILEHEARDAPYIWQNTLSDITEVVL